MTASIIGRGVALASFFLTFIVARSLAKWMKKRQQRKDEEETARTQSRQVRRAKERRQGGG